MSSTSDVTIPVYVEGEEIATLILEENSNASVVMYPGTVVRLRSDILSGERYAGIAPVVKQNKSLPVNSETFQARIEAVRAVASTQVHPTAITRSASEIEQYILNGYTEGPQARMESKFIERLRFRGFDEEQIADVMNALNDGQFAIYRARK